jgi:hypothetical protein
MTRFLRRRDLLDAPLIVLMGLCVGGAASLLLAALA